VPERDLGLCCHRPRLRRVRTSRRIWRVGRVHLACRSEAKGKAAVASLAAETGNDQVCFLPLDLASLASVHACALAFLALGQRLHVLVNNAGANEHGQTADGFEMAFGVNHLGHFTLTTALLECLAASAPARVVTVSSTAHYQAKGVDFDRLRQPTRSRTGLPEYAVSKLCNVLFTQELARRMDGRGVTTYAVHPGVVASDMVRHWPRPVRPLVKLAMLSTEQGARTSPYCATAPELAQATRRYYDKCRERTPSRVATGELGRLLWEQSEKWAAA
jgi:NAD(P)-dependent dehydrogenase (short-subunit alcohol dehydrogenase family)